MSPRCDTAVVGAGFSGLAYACARGAGDDVVVLEASPRAGGWIRTVHDRGLRFEAGPEALSGAAADVRRLADELGVEVELAPRTASKRFVVQGGELVEVPLSPPKLVTSRLLSAAAKLRLATEPLRSTGKGLDGSIADFARHRLGPQVLERLMDPMVSGIHAGDPEALSMRACFPAVVGMVEAHGSLFSALRAKAKAGTKAPGLWKPVGGMQALTDAAAQRLGQRLRLETPVRSITHTSSGGFRLELDGESLEARRVVLALSLGPARGLLEGPAPAAAAALDTMETEVLSSVYFAYPRERVAHPLDGFGYLVPHAEGRDHLGTLFSSSIAPAAAPEGQVLLRVMAGGARRPELVDLDDDALRDTLLRDLSPLLGLDGAPLWSHIERYRGALPRFDLDHPTRLRNLEAGLPENLQVLGNFTQGIGLSSLATRAYGAAAPRG